MHKQLKISLVDVKMSEDINIRFVKEQDLDELLDLCEEHAIYEKAIYFRENKKAALKTHLFEKQTLFCTVIEKDSKLIAYSTYMKQFSTWDANFYIYMDCLFVKEEYRSLGLGKKLLQRLKEESQKLNCDLIQWQTPNFNTRAIKFYENIGALSKTKERFFLDISN